MCVRVYSLHPTFRYIFGVSLSEINRRKQFALHLRYIGALAYLPTFPRYYHFPGSRAQYMIYSDRRNSFVPEAIVCTCTHQDPSTDPQSRLKQVRTKRNRTPSRLILNIQWHKDWPLPTYCTLQANTDPSGFFPHRVVSSTICVPSSIFLSSSYTRRQSHPHDVLSPVLSGYLRCPVDSAWLAWTPTSRSGNFGETGTTSSFASFCMHVYHFLLIIFHAHHH